MLKKLLILVAEFRVELKTLAYEANIIPFHYSAMKTILETEITSL